MGTNIHLKSSSMPKYVGARAKVDRTEEGVRIWLSDYKGATEEIIAEAIDEIITNADGTLTFVLPDGREIVTESLTGPQGPQGEQGIQGIQGIQGEKGDTGDSGVYVGDEEPTDPDVNVWINPEGGDSEDGSVLRLKDGDDWMPVPSIVGEAAGFGTISATVDANHGTPSVTVTESGYDTEKNLAFAFSNLQPAPYDDSVLVARMDSFTNLAEGSTTGDAELIDGRVGADGVTYNNIGGAIRGQVSDLKSALSGVSYKYSIDNTAIGSSGGAFSNTEYCCTDFIEIGEKSFFSLVDVFAGSSSLAYAFYKEDKSFISGQNNVSGDVYVDTIPQYACFVRFGTKKTNDNTGKTTEHTAVVNNCDVFTQKVIPKKTSFFEGFNIMDTGYPVFRNDRFIDASGMHAGTNTWTVVFEAEPNTDYYIMIPSRNRQTAMVSPKNPFIDQTGYTYFSPILYTKYNGENIYRVKTESNSHYIGFYFYSGEYDLSANRDDILIIKDSWIANPIIHIRTDNTIRHYGTFSILGDSYSTFEDYLTPQNAGHWYPSTLENNVTEIEQTWWYKFANQYGCSLKENVSWSGSTISYDGYGDGHADGKTISFITRMDNLSNPELILVYGGTNDSWVATESGRADFLGDYKYSGFTESDFEYFRPSVAYVLTELRKKHVGSHIVFMLNSNLTNIRESVQTICEHLNIPLCEMYGLDLTNAHPNQTGMQQIADYITDFLNVGN